MTDLPPSNLESPYPYPGGKRKTKDIVWARLGADVPNFIDPFLGSNAILLGRPGGALFFDRPGGAGKIETVNDLDGGIVNFWRALEFGDEQKVAKWCDWPVSELDMHARHDWVIERLVEMTPKLRSDPTYFNEQVAGWWCWGACIWIGTGWGAVPKKQKPRISATGTGAVGVIRSNNHKRPEVHRTHLQKPRPHLSSSPKVLADRRKPSIGNDRGIHGVGAMNTYEWFRFLKERTRRTRILCGDWKRLVTRSVLGFGKNVGGRRPTAVFLDPPYPTDARTKDLYVNDADGVYEEVYAWALANGDNPDLRIALCGYEDARFLMPDNWEMVSWKASRGLAGAANQNRKLERIWFSPYCLKPGRQPTLFDLLEDYAKPEG